FLLGQFIQGNRSVWEEAGGQSVHQVHIITQHFDSNVVPAQLLVPISRAVTAVNDQVRAVSAALARLPQQGC
ncbi:hypothetical protein CHARACLAT_006046, partial [Characodon lateralis]|nr:hypothetical protein [Characodon lateralis]